MKRRTIQGKIVSSASLIGQQGINLIASVVSEMGFLWTPTTGHSDAGIDGYIEICRTDTNDATNFVLQVQSKATAKEWENESDAGFDFRCDERDLAYWLQGKWGPFSSTLNQRLQQSKQNTASTCNCGTVSTKKQQEKRSARRV